MKNIFTLFCCWIISNHAIGQETESILRSCEEFHLLGQSDSVKKYSTYILKNASDKDQIAKAKLFLAHANHRTYPDSSYKTLLKLQKEFITLNDQKFLAYLNASLGSYYRKIGKYEQAISYYQKSIESAQNHYYNTDAKKLNRLIALQLNSISIVNFEKSDYEVSTQYALKALKIANQYDFKHIELGCGIIIGNIQMHLKQLDLAEQSFLSANKLAKNINDRYRLGVTISNLGIINLLKIENNSKDLKAYKNAKKYFFESLKIAISQKDYTAISARYSNLANVENAVNNHQRAIEYNSNALQYAELSKSKLLGLQITTSLARNYLNLEQTQKAIELAKKGLLISKELSNEKEKPFLYDILNQAYIQEKDFVKAMEFQKAEMESKDQLYKSSLSDKISELQAKYEAEKKQKEIRLLTLKNQANEAEIKQKNYLILASILAFLILMIIFFIVYREKIFKQRQRHAEMEQRLLRAQLNPHFLFNCLNSIQRLYVDGRTSLANDFISDFAQLMRDILDKTSHTKIPLHEEIEFIDSYLSLEKRRLGDKFTYTIIMDEQTKNSGLMVPSFILQPLVENALLHGILPKNEKGNIEIKVYQDAKENLVLNVMDEGVGFYHSNNKSIKHHSKAIELIKSRLGKKGRLMIEELKNKNHEVLGTSVTLTLTDGY